MIRLENKWKLLLSLSLVILMWSSSAISCEKTSAIIPKQSGYSVRQVRVLWMACSMRTREIYPNIPQHFLELGCDCSINYTIKNYTLKELNQMHDQPNKLKNFATLIRLNCNEYRM